MDRTNCQMCNVVGKEVYCSYYDFMYNRCIDVIDCPEDLDEDHDDEDYIVDY